MPLEHPLEILGAILVTCLWSFIALLIANKISKILHNYFERKDNDIS